MATKKQPIPQKEVNIDKEVSFMYWLKENWRPWMAYTYMVICLFDFIVAPIAWAIAQAYQGTILSTAWLPVTLQGAGLFHGSMGAILGVAAWGRSQEKLARITTDTEEPDNTIKKNNG